MDQRRQQLGPNKSVWATLTVQFAMITMATIITADSLQDLEQSLPTAYAWSTWSTWGPCSKTCGSGVAVQERECLPRGRINNLTTLIPPRIQKGDCPGVARRYHECNITPCNEGELDARAEQCSAYDRRPFRGRYYHWMPYIDGNAPCMLNCRPAGQQFYASLGLVADGTPCTEPGYRAICIQGVCKAVGRDSVLAVADGREMRCGRRLVSGLFSRQRLPLGYSFVTTIPRGACRINITEIVPSDNYISLRVTNGTYIMNGEFAISAPGSYDAVGTRFTYSRVLGLDTVFALGPIHSPIDLMILYTEPNPNIKYEYLTETLPGDLEIESITKITHLELQPTMTPKHIRRHHGYDTSPMFPLSSKSQDVTSLTYSNEPSSSETNLVENVVGGRRFIWKITSYTQCSRTCGGGIQVGKFRCVEETADGMDREISPIHCKGAAPTGRRRRCGNTPCPPRWRAAAWSSCPICGPATRRRNVGCVQDHSRGITKVSDHMCPPPKPSITEKCIVPDCSDSKIGEVRQVETKRVTRPREFTETFREGPVYTITVNSTDIDVGPEYTFSATARWLSTDWSECVGWCVGGGVQTRNIRCGDPSGCSPLELPEQSRNCNPSTSCETHQGQWFTGDWSPCSSTCGGKQVRGVLCVGGSGRHLKDSSCKDTKPEHERNCGEDCKPAWYFSEWGQCAGNCTYGVGVQQRTVVCARGSHGAKDEECSSSKPSSSRHCDLPCTRPISVTPRTVTSIHIATTTGMTQEESSRTSKFDTEKTESSSLSTSKSTTTKDLKHKDCEDKLKNCALAVQARLCHYNYYIQNCCKSCA